MFVLIYNGYYLCNKFFDSWCNDIIIVFLFIINEIIVGLKKNKNFVK